jgi:hypothetical protein
MPKIIDYPRASLQRSFALAEAVDKLGGEVSDDMAAESMGNKIGGAFKALISSAVKYGLISASKGRLTTEALFQDYKLAYSETQKQEAIRRAFLNAPLFAAVATRLQGQQIPPHFEKLLIREHGVPEDTASRVAGYFTEGARDAGIIGAGGVIAIPGPGSTTGTQAPTTAPMLEGDNPSDDADVEASVPFVRGYTVRITGPGIDSRIAIKDEDDVDIVEAMLKKVRRLLKQQQEPEGTN